MACHTPSLKVPSLGPISFNDVEFRDEMGPSLGNGFSVCFFAVLNGGVFEK